MSTDTRITGTARHLLVLTRYGRLCVRHARHRPYRGGARGVVAHPALTASYDALLNLLVDGWVELEGVPPPRSPGRIAVALNRVGLVFDDVFERLRDDEPPPRWEDIVAHPDVAARVAELEGVLVAAGGRRAAARVRDYLGDEMADGFGEYVRRTRLAVAGGPEDLVRLAELDSGGQLRALATVWALTTGRRAIGSATARQFTALGVIAKLTDDVRDVRADHAARRPNVVTELAAGYGREQAALLARCDGGRSPRLRWYRQHAPRTRAGLVALFDRYDAELTAPSLRAAGTVLGLAARTRGLNRDDHSAGRA